MREARRRSQLTEALPRTDQATSRSKCSAENEGHLEYSTNTKVLGLKDIFRAKIGISHKQGEAPVMGQALRTDLQEGKKEISRIIFPDEVDVWPLLCEAAML